MTATADLGFAAGLAAHGDRVALVTPDGTAISYRELDDRVSTAVDRLGPVRRLVLLAVRNDVDSLVTYLAALRGGHPVLLTAPAQVAALSSAYDPDVVVDGRWTEHRTGTAHELHPDLALLLSTSGSTGSPKLVRLSADNLAANAEAIAEYLDIRPTDRAITSLPMHYCYGLSVVNSNLLRGAGLVLTDRSVVDPAFWTTVREHRVTSLHGVPHTFDLLDTVGFERMDLPSLRYVTQAGGRLAPESVRRFARLGEERGWRLFVMYGQTEATARMAYLPPELARTHPSAIGVPIPGGDFDIADDGELVYRGPNVMLGYAHRAADLALGRTTGELRTGDLARRTPEGLYEVIGRKNRFLKLYGLRIDLDRVERVLAEDGFAAVCAGTDDVLVVAVRGAVRRVDQLVRARFGLPRAGVRVVRVREFPRLPNGKVDYAAVAGIAPDSTAGGGSVRQVFASALGVSDVPDDATFVDLGGDSLSYVQTSVALERVLGPLPENWPTTPVAELERRRAPVSRTPSVETNIVLRALAIVLVVGSHIEFFDITGGAHLLLVIAGWNFARFVLPAPARMVRSAALIAAPAVLWLAYRVAVTDDVTVVNVLLVNNFVGTGAIGYWFVEVVVHALVAFAILFAVPAVRRVERAHGFVTALVFLGAALLLRVGFDASSSFAERNMTTLGALWFFVLGWLVQRAETRWQKVVVLVLALALVPGTFDDRAREAVVVVGLVLLVVVARVWLPKAAVTAVTLVASASLYIYLTHYAVFPALLGHLPRSLVVVSSLAAGIITWHVVRRYQRTVARWYRRTSAYRS
ncbi:AMP-dependent synthetase [Saccharothrix sp. ALI-22-I]|uniref:non-ribosomal peptide synthetase n=1 Tax=Saccharothrix sp. ALI-22-I TaxID=1933778 RepID=UPI00097CBFF9|nr:non-ribosomal peptide synthetase [Saccharothrix sp. ALI-22-I]ONI84694.1 AMP-dependent synthetase [Saccharothrix sp. ALI-22-I]